MQGNRAKTLAVVGVNHRTARVEMRERFAFRPEEAQSLLRALVGRGGAREAVLLSTCNRTELYLALREDGTPDVGASMLSHHAGTLREEAAPYLYVHEGQSCVEHLYRVTAGLDSLVPGEAQIQGQVKTAYELAASGARAGLALVGPELARLFQSALAVGGRVRSQTGLSAGAASVPGAAVELAAKVLGSLRDRQVVVLGAGEMSRLAAQVLVKEGVRPPVVVSRTRAHARQLAVDVGGVAAGFERMAEQLAAADLLVTATSAPHALVTEELMQRALALRGNRQLCVIDLAVPRDVDPEVAGLSGVFLFDLDDLRRVVDGNLARRRAESPAAEQLIAQAAAEFGQWLEARDAVPVIRTMRGHAEAVRQRELGKALERLRHLPPVEQQRIEHLTQQLVNKVLHAPTVKLREAAANGDGVMLLAAARYLFE
ncbi:MAG TPA: glutamyl-tRNA reductase [Longimicrobiales bacterium]|nr:glutamyl-tRNA reductase [Longimicrobiales bacterium]